MSDEEREETSDERADAEADDVELAPEDEEAVRALLKRSMGGASGAHVVPSEKALVRGFQERMRKRSKGKFYRDGWSTTQSRVSVALVATLMLLLAVVVYLAMGPTGISP